MLFLWVCLIGGALPVKAWKDIKIDLTNGNLLTSDEITNKTLVKFGVAIADDGTATRVAADDASAAIVLNGKYHSNEHGWGNFSATVAVEGNVKISMGTCAWGGDVIVTNTDGTQVATFNTNNGTCYHNNKTANIASTTYKGDATTLTISGGAYTPYIAVEKIKDVASVVFPFKGNTTDATIKNPEDGFSKTEITVGKNIPESGAKGYDGITYTTFKPSATGSFDNDENAVVFKIVPNENKFIPTKVSANIRRFGTDGGLMSVRIKNEEGKTATLGKDLIPARNKAQDQDAKKDEPNFRTAFEYDIPSGFDTEKGFYLIINIYNNTNKQFGINNVTIEGALASKAIQHTISLVASPTEGGSVSVEPQGTKFAEGTKLTIKANSNSGYEFVNWTDADNNEVSTDRTASITLNKDMTLTANFKKSTIITGKLFTWYVSDGTTTSLSDGTDYKYIRTSESNQSFAIKGKSKVGGDSRFKASEGENNTWALVVPANAIVEKVEFTNCSENYYQNPDATSNITTTFNVASEGATVTTTDANGDVLEYLSKGQTITSTIANHQAGTPITFYADGGRQLAFSTINIYYSITDNGSLSLTKQSINDGATVERNGNIVFSFDNDVTLVDGASVKVNGNNVRTVANGAHITAYFWGLAYNSENTVTLAANSVTDGFGNKYDKEISFKVNVGSKQAVNMKAYDYVVSNAEELDAAIAELTTTNKAATAEHKTVFLKNGKYTYGTLTGNYQHNVSLDKIYNVSLIGESKDGVLIEGTTNGITSSTLHLGDNGTGKYIQDLTIRNNYDFRATAFKGVSVAVTGGNKTIMKNVAMQSSQDTYVTSKRTYLEDCDIYGITDFICGGGDIFFEHCNLILGNKSGNVIVAPNTDAATQWGYVLNNCTVKADDGATKVTDKSWNLGRPWQNEPRAYFLYTKMNVLCSDAGWTTMSNLPTHFYEYKSVDKNGKEIDLSTRKNSPTSTNKYTPVLTDAEAVEFTAYNVVGGNDGWDVAAYTKQVTAPTELIAANNGTLTWNKVEDALLYAIFKDGKYIANTTECEYTATENGTYTVRAANEMGGLGEASETVEVNLTITAKLSAGGMGTFCATKTVKTPNGLTAYTATVNNNTVTLNKIEDGIIPANNGVVLSGEANATYDMEYATSDKTQLEGNDLKGTLERTLIENDYSFVLVYDNTENVSYFKNFKNGAYIPANKAYLEIPTATQNTMLRVVINNGGATGINNIENNNNDTKPFYTISGQKTTNPQKGIYIHNGKKVIIK